MRSIVYVVKVELNITKQNKTKTSTVLMVYISKKQTITTNNK